MNEILQIIIILPIFLILLFLPIKVFGNKNKFFTNAKSIDILALNIILNCNIFLALSFLTIKIDTYQPLYIITYLLIFIYNYVLNTKVNIIKLTQVLKKLFIPSIIFYFFSVTVASELNLGWDAKYFYYIKSLFYFDGLFFSDLNKFEHNLWHPHLGSFVWAFFWKISFLDIEYFGRLFFVFLYCFSIFFICESLKQSEFYKNLLYIFTAIILFSYDRFSGLQEIFIFSLLIIASQYFISRKKQNNLLPIISIMLICNLFIWIKSEGIVFSLILFTILIFNKFSSIKLKFYLSISFILLIIFRIFIYDYFDFNLNAQPYYNFHYVFKLDFQTLLYKLKYIILYSGWYTLNNPLFILGLTILLYLNITNNKNIELYNFNIYFVLNSAFILSAYLFREMEIEYSLKTTLERIIFTSSGFYAFLVINFFNRFLKKNKKK